jgi:hypothetical protein
MAEEAVSGGKPRSHKSKLRQSFYSKALSEAESANLEEAARVEGLDDEIALLRLRLRQLLEEHPEDIEIQMEAASTLARLMRTRYRITKEQKESLKRAIAKTLIEVAIPLGVKYLPK